ncbi:long-chain-fatty-acid--CoA ligase [Rhizobium alvei]|uniref:Long-chain-fatty-acid--CoA ligase n=1 Tax=Rhizobium alvei TaxID=1132659 RepID=A0ABT8YN64_9HYPH|nr:long-chain-fatty-acid--CoA ligase [Rhizobium alvei]MDO6965134.1 long-chain-fatty-acid--CoA ligase [Rhizobium alvei]
MTVHNLSLDGKASNRIWLKSYPEGVPSEIGALTVNSVAELFENSCKKFASKPAFISMGKTMTYADIDAASAKVAAWLQAKGLVKGDRVAVMFPNVLQYPVTVMGILRAGMTVVNVNPLYTPRELEHQLKDSGAKAIFVLENFANTVAQAIGKTDVKHVVVAAMGDLLGFKGLIVNLVVRKVKKLVPAWSIAGHTPFKSIMGGSGAFKPVTLTLDDVAFLQYTGGTTGVSKGATLTNRNVVANAEQSGVWLNTAYRLRGGHPDDILYCCALPLYHIFALTVNMVMGMADGAANLLIANPRDIPAFVKELSQYRVNFFPGLNTLFNALANNPEFKKLDFSSLILTVAGGMACQRPVADLWKSVTGSVILEGYGLSETSPIVTVNPPNATEFSGTIGLPIPSTEVEIRDDDGNTLPIGEIGEICIRGPQVMAGYWNRPDETAKVMSADGFFRSGDMAFMDENGYVKIVDRKKDMILVSGFNVYPNEIEEVAASHPGVLEAAAIGVPDEHSGEAVKLFIVRKDPALTAEDVKAHCAKQLTNYKRPKHVEFRDSLPKTNVGKILRKDLRS